MLDVERDVERWRRVEDPAEQLMEETFVMIGGSDLIVIDLAEKGVGLDIEAGYAHARGTPVLVSAPHGADVSLTLTGIARRVVRYDRPVEIAAGVVG